jgi:hypothetical protein
VAHDLAPRFTVDGKEVILDVLNAATIFADRLGPPIASLADDASRGKLIGALHELMSQA